jgi:hypothetical protein
MVVKVVFNSVPTMVMAAIMTTAISAAIAFVLFDKGLQPIQSISVHFIPSY